MFTAAVLFLFPGETKSKKKKIPNYAAGEVGPASGEFEKVTQFKKKSFAAKDVSTEPSPTSPPEDLVRNPGRSGFPHPTESDNGWGGGADKWDIVDGTRQFPSWANGLAFTGGINSYAGPCGWKQATINFGEPKTFNRVMIWHHGREHIPNTYKLLYWDGSNWVELFSTTEGWSYLKYKTDTPQNWWEAFSTPTENTFPTVTSQKVRFQINNCDITHGWIYSFEVYMDHLVTVIYPNGEESLEVGSQQNITWSTVGTVGDVKIEYSVDNGDTWIELATVTQNDGTHPWTIPDAVSDQCLVRVSESDGEPTDASDAVFTIAAPPGIPPIERAALIALYNSTNGDSWTDNSGWKTPPLHSDGFANPGTEGTWYGISCDADGRKVQTISLSNNNLVGTLPPELGNLSNLYFLRLSHNQLNGNIPSQLGDLAQLGFLFLDHNQFTGSIPAELGNLTNLRFFWFSHNQFTGNIPSQLGNLAKVEFLFLGHNRLTGSIPPEWSNLTALEIFWVNANALAGSIPTGLTGLARLSDIDIGCNALYTDDETLRTFLNQRDPGWQSTQTTAPTNLSAAPVTSSSVELSWTPIAYTYHPGGYRVLYSTTQGGGYTLFGTTADKTVSSMTVTGLTPDTTYYFVVQTQTSPHAGNQNTVYSTYSDEAAATPLAVPTITITSPNGGENLIIRDSRQITWTIANVSDTLKITLFKDGAPMGDIAALLDPTSGSYQWTVGEYSGGTAAPGPGYNLKIKERKKPVSDFCDASFTLSNPPPITVISPNGGEDWKLGSSRDITWKTFNVIETLKITLLKDGTPIGDIAALLDPASGSYTWTVGETSGGTVSAGTGYVIKIKEKGKPISDFSDAPFTISN